VSHQADSKFDPILFLEGAGANKDVPKEELNRVVQIIKGYHDLFKDRGIRFIFLSIPSKENIFYESLGTRRPVFLEQLITRLKQLGIETVDIQKAFKEVFQKDQVLLFHTDDTHWNGNAARIAADLFTRVIKSGLRSLRQQ
jgi:hypothetical protein